MDIHHRDESEGTMATKLLVSAIEGNSWTYDSLLNFDNMNKYKIVQ